MRGAIATFDALKNGEFVPVDEAWHAECAQKEFYVGTQKAKKGEEACERRMEELDALEQIGVENVRFVGGKYREAE